LPTGSGCDLWKKAHLKIERSSRKIKKDNQKYAMTFEGPRWIQSGSVCDSAPPFSSRFVSLEGGKLEKLAMGKTTNRATSQIIWMSDG